MPVSQKNQAPLAEEYQEILVRLPIWDDGVWEPLQKKDFKAAMDRFFTLMGYYTRKTVQDIYWKNIIQGDEAVRGSVTSDEWRMQIVPRLAQIFLEIGEETLFEKIYSSLDWEWLAAFHFSVVGEIPGISVDEKASYLTKEKSWLLDFFIGSPMNALAEGLLFDVSEGLPRPTQSLASYPAELSPALKKAFFSVPSAKKIITLSSELKWERQQTVDFSYVVGLFLLGVEEKERWEELFEKIFSGYSPEQKENVSKLAYRLLVKPLEGDTRDLRKGTESVIQEKEVSVPVAVVEEKSEKAVKINKVEFPKAAENQAVDPSAPFMLRTEEDSALKKTPAGNQEKGFSFPFGFFKRSAQPTQASRVSVKIESAAEPAGPTGTPKVQKPAQSVFETVQKDIARAPAEGDSVFGSLGKDLKEAGAKKTVHYSQFHTPLPEPAPHIEGNTVSFK
jgi:hypothetical protein